MINTKLAKIVFTVAVAASTMLVSAPSRAGMVWFSRANCFNNESITWDWPGNNHMLWTNSFHYNGRAGRWEAPIRTGWQWTYRSAAIHAWEGLKGGYYVIGHHFNYSYPQGEYLMGYTPTTNCQIHYFFPYW